MERHSEAWTQPQFKRQPACSESPPGRVSPLLKHLAVCVFYFCHLLLQKQGKDPEVITGNTSRKVGLEVW